jgi:hypothetical protein
MDGVSDLRNLILRTLNDNQLLILTRLKLISYGSRREKRCAEVESLGALVLRLLTDRSKGATIRFPD